MAGFVECPEMERWQDLLHDDLPPGEREQCERHLESCPRCQELLDHAEEFTEELRARARRVGDPTRRPPDPAWNALLERLHGVRSAAHAGPAEPADLYFLRPSDRPGVLGTLGDYEVLEVVGQGGMGVVLKAFDPGLNRFVAIKVMAAAVAGSAMARRRFTREARAAAAVCHDHVIAVHGVHEFEGLPYLVMQYVGGESLQERLDRAGPLEVEDVVRIGLQTAAGLAAAHAQGLIHRDIKPANLLLENGVARVKITDFGLARMADAPGLTQAGVAAGTPEYMAPEQARGEPVDHRADLFSLGGVLYACCTGEPPFQGSSTVAVLRRVSDEQPAPIRARNPCVPAWLETVITRLMEKDPAHRFRSAAEVAALLEGYLAHLRQPAAVSAPELPPAPGSGPSGRRGAGRWFTATGWLVALVLVAAGLIGARAVLPQVAPPAGPPLAGEFYQDFRGGQAPVPPLYLTGPDATTFTRPGAGGYRVTLPRDRKQMDRVGLEMPTRLRGDFEITAGYEILQVEQPVKGHGVAFALLVETDSSRDDVVELTRTTRVGEGEVYNCARISTDDAGQRTYNHQFPPASGERGRLRLTRSGREVTLSAAEGDAGEFTELARYDLGTEDVILVSVTGFTGYAPNQLDLRILDLRVRGQGPSAAATSARPAAGPANVHSRGWLAAAGCIGLLILLTALGVWLVAARRRRAEGKGQPAPGPADSAPGGRNEAAPGARPAVARRFPARLWPLLLVPVGVAAVVLGAWLARTFSTPPPRPDGERPADGTVFHQDFRAADFDPDVLKPFGPGVERDASGLRLTLEAGQDQSPNTGLDTTFPVRGDFEISASYDVRSADRPEKGYGVGVGLYAPIDPATQDAVSLARRLFPDGTAQFVANRMTPADGGRVHFQVKKMPSHSPAGKLRLERVGSVLRFLVADGPDAPFVVLDRVDLGIADLQYVRVEAGRGGSEAGLEARVLDFSVLGGGLTGLPDAAPAGPGPPRQGQPVLAAVAAGLLIGLALLGGWLLTRRGRRGSGAPVADTVVRRKPPVPLVSFACPGCGHGLKVKAELAGKKGKCPKCGHVLLVPAPVQQARPGSPPA
jgi:hypothetical protein